jgi:hypothetical protein
MRSIRNVFFGFGGAVVLSALSALLLAVAPPQALSQDSDQMLRERFLQDAPARWEEYARLTGELQGSLSVVAAVGDDKIIANAEYKTNGKSKLVKATRRKEGFGRKAVDIDEEVFAVNPQYAFILHRKSAEAPWALTELADLSHDTVPYQIDKFISRYLKYVMMGTRLDEEALPDVVRSSGFRVDRCHPIQRDGENLVEVAFTYTVEGSQGPTITQTGSLVFDPSRQWRLRSGDVQVRSEGVRRTEKIQVTETEPRASSPISRVYEVENEIASQGKPPSHQRVRSEATLSQPANLPADEEFTLSAFGLPEPPAIRRHGPWYLWAAMAGLLCLGAGTILRYLKRQSAHPAAPA